MASIVTVYNKAGIRLAFLNVPTVRSWSLNDEQNAGFGTCSFRISTSDPKCTRANLRAGNLILIEDENAELPDWVGFIDSVQGSEFGYGYVDISGVAAEAVASWRIAPIRPVKGTPGNVLKDVIDFANTIDRDAMPVYYGTIYTGGRGMYLAPGQNMLDAIKKISKASGNDWSVTGALDDNNSLLLYVNMYNGQRGDNTNTILSEKNTKLISPSIIESGEIYNLCYYYGQASGGAINYAIAKNQLSVALYGLRAAIRKSGGTDQQTLQYLADDFVRKSAFPKRVLTVVATRENGLFKQMDIGNIFTFDSNTYGFFNNSQIGAHETVRIVGIEYDDQNEGELPLVAEIL